MIKIKIPGTSPKIPTKKKKHHFNLITYKKQGILVSCGEGTQRQLRIAGIKPGKITKLLITHWHGDHVLGIPGLIQNLAANNYKNTLEIYGPRGTKRYLRNLMSGIILQKRLKYEVKELSSGVFYKNDFTLEAAPLDHLAPCLAYSFKEKDRRKINLDYTKKFNLIRHPLLGNLQKGKDIVYKGKKISAGKATELIKGKKITIIMDTAPTANAVKIAKNSDILIAESTWSRELEKFVMKRKHLTAELAAKMAKQSNAKKLILTHFSQRYKNIKDLESEAKKVFKNTVLAEDFMTVTI